MFRDNILNISVLQVDIMKEINFNEWTGRCAELIAIEQFARSAGRTKGMNKLKLKESHLLTGLVSPTDVPELLSRWYPVLCRLLEPRCRIRFWSIIRLR